MAISNQIGFQQNYPLMQPYGCERFSTTTGSRVYTHIDGSIRVQEKPLGYIIGEFLLYAAQKVDFTISRFIPSLPGARALSTPSLSRNKNCCSEASSLRMENTVFRASAKRWRKEVKVQRNQTDQCRQENLALSNQLTDSQANQTRLTQSYQSQRNQTEPKNQQDLDKQLRNSKKERDQYRSCTIIFSILTTISLIINLVLGFLMQRSKKKSDRYANPINNQYASVRLKQLK